MKFVVSLAFCELTQLAPLARAAETAGFDHVALSDHIVHPERIRTPYPYTPDGRPRWEPFTPWPDPWVAIGAMAAVTERIRFLTSVFVLPLRNPFQVAKTVATAAVLSDGRVSLGIGMGWMRDEFELMEQDFSSRGRRADEMIEVMRKLWSGGMVEHHGRFYDFDRLEMSPVPAQPIPIYVGGISAAAQRRVARLADGWIADLHTTDELLSLIRRLRELRAEAGRSEEPLQVFAAVSDAVTHEDYRRLEEIGVSHVLTMPWLFYGASETLAQKLDGIARFGDDVVRKLA